MKMLLLLLLSLHGCLKNPIYNSFPLKGTDIQYSGGETNVIGFERTYDGTTISILKNFKGSVTNPGSTIDNVGKVGSSNRSFSGKLFVYFPGNDGNDGDKVAKDISIFTAADLNVVAISYRQVDGESAEASVKKQVDALYKEYVGPQGVLFANKADLIAFGFSFGTHFSLHLAKEQSVKAVALAPYISFEYTLKEEIGYGIPHQWFFGSGLDNRAIVSSTDTEFIIAHNDQDPTLPFEDGEKLHSFRKAHKDEDHFIKMSGAKHEIDGAQLVTVKNKMTDLGWFN